MFTLKVFRKSYDANEDAGVLGAQPVSSKDMLSFHADEIRRSEELPCVVITT